MTSVRPLRHRALRATWVTSLPVPRFPSGGRGISQGHGYVSRTKSTAGRATPSSCSDYCSQKTTANVSVSPRPGQRGFHGGVSSARPPGLCACVQGCSCGHVCGPDMVTHAGCMCELCVRMCLVCVCCMGYTCAAHAHMQVCTLCTCVVHVQGLYMCVLCTCGYLWGAYLAGVLHLK